MRTYSRRGFTAATSSAVLMSPVLLTACVPIWRKLNSFSKPLSLCSLCGPQSILRGSVAWNEDATKAVNKVLDTSVGMTDELKQLNIPISTGTNINISDAERSLRGRMDAFAGPILPLLKEYQSLENTNPKKGGVEVFTHELETDVFKCCGIGPAAYQTTFTAIVVVRAVYKYLGRTPDEQKPFFERVNRYFNAWVNDKVDDSPAALLKREESEFADLERQLSEHESIWEKLVGSKGRERDRHKNNKMQLAQVLSQLNNYQESFSRRN